ncbi:hypothetical protein J6590_041010 [Homalodisca vitripennis]|nr:hypothetical protein J6590_041010 [Homalodisca vitripennis]
MLFGLIGYNEKTRNRSGSPQETKMYGVQEMGQTEPSAGGYITLDPVTPTALFLSLLTMLSRCLTDLNQLFQSPPTTANSFPEKDVSFSFSQSHPEFSSSFTKSQRNGLDSLIEKLDDLYKKNKLENAAVAGIVELYQYKLADTRRTEQGLQASLAAADRHHTQLSHHVAHLNAETARLHQLLYSSQQAQQGFQLELSELRQQLVAAQESATTSHIKFKQLKQDVHSKSMIIKDQNDEIVRLKQTVEEHSKRCEELKQRTTSLMEEREEQNIVIQKLEQKTVNLEENVQEQKKCIQNLETVKTDLQASNSKLEEKLEERNLLLSEKESLLEKKTAQIKSLENDLSNLKVQMKSLENQLVDFEKMRKIIFEITGGKKSNY